LLTYRILKHKVQRDVLLPVEARQVILKRELGKSHLKIGDKVRFKKPRRNPIKGIIKDILSDMKDVKWGPGSCPLNVVVEVDKVDVKSRISYGKEIIHTNMKKLIAI